MVIHFFFLLNIINLDTGGHPKRYKRKKDQAFPISLSPTSATVEASDPSSSLTPLSSSPSSIVPSSPHPIPQQDITKSLSRTISNNNAHDLDNSQAVDSTGNSGKSANGGNGGKSSGSDS